MIFSLLKLRKKTSATLAGIAIAAACLWGLSLWQDIPISELATLLGAVVLMLGAIIVSALLLITAIKLLLRLGRRLLAKSESNQD